MQTVVETPSYLRAAKDAGLSEREMKDVVDAIATDPMQGDSIVGSGGCRKVRFAGRGKGEKSTLSDAEVNALAGATRALAEAHRQQARKIRVIKQQEVLCPRLSTRSWTV